MGRVLLSLGLKNCCQAKSSVRGLKFSSFSILRENVCSHVVFMYSQRKLGIILA